MEKYHRKNRPYHQVSVSIFGCKLQFTVIPYSLRKTIDTVQAAQHTITESLRQFYRQIKISITFWMLNGWPIELLSNCLSYYQGCLYLNSNLRKMLVYHSMEIIRWVNILLWQELYLNWLDTQNQRKLIVWAGCERCKMNEMCGQEREDTRTVKGVGHIRTKKQSE